HESGGAAPGRLARGRNYDVVAGLAAERVEKTSGRISAKRLLPAARVAGYAGSDRNFRRLVAPAKEAWRAEHRRGRRPAVWSPGEYLVIDWGSAGGLHVLCVLARHLTSDMDGPVRLAQLHPSYTNEDFLAGSR